jgi:hypothetical protein
MDTIEQPYEKTGIAGQEKMAAGHSSTRSSARSSLVKDRMWSRKIPRLTWLTLVQFAAYIVVAAIFTFVIAAIIAKILNHIRRECLPQYPLRVDLHRYGDR